MTPQTTNRIAICVGLVVAGLVSCTAVGQIIETPETKVIPKLTVKGTAELEKPADQLHITIGVQTEDPEAAEAMEQNSRRMQDIVRDLGKLGLTSEEYQTGRFRVRPKYSPRPRQPSHDWEPHIIGFDVINTIQIRTSKLDKAGELIQAANEAGANTVDNIRFDLEDRRIYRAEAITQATQHAVDDATTLASASGVKLVRLLSVTLDSAGSQFPDLGSGMARGRMMAAAAESSAPPPINPGDVTVTASVTLVYEIASNTP